MTHGNVQHVSVACREDQLEDTQIEEECPRRLYRKGNTRFYTFDFVCLFNDVVTTSDYVCLTSKE